MHEMLTGVATSVATIGSMVLLGYLSLALFAWVTGRPALGPEWRPVALLRRAGLQERRQLRRLQRQVDEAFAEAAAEMRDLNPRGTGATEDTRTRRRDWL